MIEPLVVLVDRRNRRIGVERKMAAHQAGHLHRAFSIFVRNGNGLLLLQRRAVSKYHSGGLWSNTCCSHPRPGESTRRAAHRRLKEEMGFDCALAYAFGFRYRALVDEGLIEHEFDHIFLGRHDSAPSPDRAEVDDWRWMSVDALRRELDDRPEAYTIWLKIAFTRLLAWRFFTMPS